MRDRRFVAVHRGGPLELERHRFLALWAADCAEHVLPLFESYCPEDGRPREAIELARAWARGHISVGEARKASVAAHAAARSTKNPAARAAARAAGHAVATAHMADHAKGPAYYAIKAILAAYPDDPSAVEREQCWQRARIPDGIRDLIESEAA